MASILVELFRHNLWANLELLDFCRTLGEDHLDASAPGTYGRVRDTLVHLVAAEERYVGLLTGERPERPLRESEGFPSLDDLRARAEWTGTRLIAAAGRARPTRVLRGTWGGRPYRLSVAVPLLQAINHATEHRAHVATVLSQHGVQPPELDGWAFDRAVLQR